MSSDRIGFIFAALTDVVALSKLGNSFRRTIRREAEALHSDVPNDLWKGCMKLPEEFILQSWVYSELSCHPNCHYTWTQRMRLRCLNLPLHEPECTQGLHTYIHERVTCIWHDYLGPSCFLAENSLYYCGVLYNPVRFYYYWLYFLIFVAMCCSKTIPDRAMEGLKATQ